jgi:putative transposase
MTNHVHLLVTPSVPDGVSRLMQDVGREYVRRINAKYRRSGTLWEGRFKSSLIDSEAFCLICYQYIELNPVRAAMVSDPSDYVWSSYHANALGQPDPLVTPHEQWLALGRNKVACYQAYQKFLKEQPSISAQEEIRYNNRKGLPLGGRPFRALIESRLQIKLGSGKVGRPPKTK